MAVDGGNIETGLSGVKTVMNLSHDQDVIEENNYTDLFGLCDETTAEVPDTEINLRCHKSSNILWNSPEQKKYKQKNTATSRIQKLLDFEDNTELDFHFETSVYTNKKDKNRTKLKLLKRKRSCKSLNNSSMKSLPLCEQLQLTPILSVPPNSPCNGIKRDISYDNPFITCLLDILEKTRMNNLTHTSKESQYTSSLLPKSSSSVETNSLLPETSICTTEVIPIPDVETPTTWCPESNRADDDHVVPQVSQLMNAHNSSNTTRVFYDNDLPVPHHQRVMQSCINQDHIVPNVIEE